MIGGLVECILKLEGFVPRYFSNPEDALRSLAEDGPKPALLLTDFLMAPINGMELIQRCKQVEPDLKTILYSGNVGEDIMRFYPVAPDGFLSKPFLPKTLVDMVDTVLDRA